ncbi:MAG: hypothetical protein KKA73_15860 [Chloroflexi bacterium]|nr:hypothetical protein [Chloroflexota bacterium]MBU1749160.1 hypothetical protein [Chloroflexota bacterium]
MAKEKQEQEGMTREELLAIIDQAAREGWTELDLSGRGISELPAEIGRLTNLQTLDLRNNQLTALPEVIGQLTNLQTLYLAGNQLTELPEWLGNLAELTDLWLGYRGESVKNSFGQIPVHLRHLKKLRVFGVSNCQLTELPDWLGEMAPLQQLWCDDNHLTELPKSLAQLRRLTTLTLEDNPLNPALQSAYKAGLPELMAYLRSLEEGAEPLYEAKLILVGEGGVGKTTLLKALTGQEPREGEPTTHGVSIEVHAMHLPHPEQEDVAIQLNAWDFGGQEVYRVTHQFFFSRRSIYLVVWEPRKGVQQCQVEDWLKMIRLRVGNDARIIVVSTHCRTGQRIARIDKPVLQRDYPMIADFCEVDSLVDDPATGEKVGVAELKALIAQTAQELE